MRVEVLPWALLGVPRLPCPCPALPSFRARSVMRKGHGLTPGPLWPGHPRWPPWRHATASQLGTRGTITQGFWSTPDTVIPHHSPIIAVCALPHTKLPGPRLHRPWGFRERWFRLSQWYQYPQLGALGEKSSSPRGPKNGQGFGYEGNPRPTGMAARGRGAVIRACRSLLTQSPVGIPSPGRPFV